MHVPKQTKKGKTFLLAYSNNRWGCEIGIGMGVASEIVLWGEKRAQKGNDKAAYEHRPHGDRCRNSSPPQPRRSRGCAHTHPQSRNHHPILCVHVRSSPFASRLPRVTQAAPARMAATEEAAAAKESKGERRRKKFDIATQWTRHVALRVAYLGWGYDGFAAQDSTPHTIEAHLHAALRRACLVGQDSTSPRTDYAYSRCGRTDRGVSAFGQVVAARLRSKLRSGRGIIPPAGSVNPAPDAAPDDAAEIDYVSAINSGLPEDIRVLGWAPVGADFNARFDCKWRLYHYYLRSQTPLDVAAMRAAAASFVGDHDFRNFCRADLVNVASFVRTIIEVDIEDHVPAIASPQAAAATAMQLLCIRVRGTGFLWHQVRCMVAVLTMVGRGEEDSSIVARLLDIAACPGKPSYTPADERPLVLYDCGYEPPLQFRGAAAGLSSAWDAFAAVLSESQVRVAMISSMLADMAHFSALMLPLRGIGSGASAGAAIATLPLSEARVQLAESKAKHEASKRRRSLADAAAEAQSLEQRIEALGPTKRRRYEERMELRCKHAAAAAAAAAADGGSAGAGADDGGE